MIFEVLEVLGEGLETLSEMEATKRALERCLRVPFCRFGEIFEILRVTTLGVSPLPTNQALELYFGRHHRNAHQFSVGVSSTGNQI